MSDFRQSSVRVYDNKHVDEKGDIKVDIYAPPENKDKREQGHPIIFYIHGGAWHVGNKESSKNPCETLAKEGYLCVATSYSLSSLSNNQLEAVLAMIIIVMLALALTSRTTTQMMFVFMIMLIIVFLFVILWLYIPRDQLRHPAHIMDIAQSFKWTVDNAKQYGGDPDRIYVMGHSAGGHLASLLSTNFNYLEEISVDPSRIKACISISGVYSDKRLSQTKMGQQLLFNAFGQRKHYYDAFPIYSVTPITPPFLLLNAGMDMSLKRHTLDMHYVLRQNGVYVQTEYFEDKSHWNIMHGWQDKSANILKTIKDFIEETEDYYIDKNSRESK